MTAEATPVPAAAPAPAPADAPARPAQGGRAGARLLTGVLLFPAALWYVRPAGPAARHRRHLLVRHARQERRLRARPSSSTTTPAPSSKPEPFIDEPADGHGRHHRLPARRPAAGLLHGHPGGQAQGPAHPPAGHPVLDELPHPDLRLAAHPRTGHRASATAIGSLYRRRVGSDLLGTPFAVLIGLVYGYLPLMVFPLYVTLERMDRTLDRGVQGPRRRPLGDLPPDHPAHRAARPRDRQHPRLHPDDGRVRHPADPRPTARPT